MRIKQSILMIIIAAMAFLGTGCMSRNAIVKDYYLVQTSRPGTPAQASSEIVLKVLPFSIGAGYQSKGFVYYLGDQRYDSDFYNEYFVPPTQMLAEQTQNWLADSGMFARVVPSSSLIEPTHILEGDIRRFYYDVQDDDNLQAVLDVTFYLIAKEGRRASKIEFTKNYHVTRPFDEQIQQQAVNAMNPCLTEVLTELEKDVAQYLKQMNTETD